jgi:hypothetical protein
MGYVLAVERGHVGLEWEKVFLRTEGVGVTDFFDHEKFKYEMSN